MKRIIKRLVLLSLFIIFTISAQATRAKVFYHGNRLDNKIYLTFDDGYSAKNTQAILDILKEKNIQATFFIEGGFLKENPLICKRIAEEQTLANHTFSHTDITKLTDEEFVEDIKKYEELALKITGKEVTKYFRPPMGIFDEDKLNLLGDMGYTVFMWDVSYYDYVPDNDKGYDFALKNLLTKTENGSIILMHTLTKSNVLVLDEAIELLEKKGYVFSPLSQLL
jgi:peptidoglycan-N-acetylmuramic acid deacetylase